MPDYGYTVSAFSLAKPILRARNAHVHRSPFLTESWLPPDRLSASSQSLAGSRLGMGRRWMELTLILCFGSAYRTRIFTCWAARHVWRSKPDYLKKTIGNQALEHHFFKKKWFERRNIWDFYVWSNTAPLLALCWISKPKKPLIRTSHGSGASTYYLKNLLNLLAKHSTMNLIVQRFK